MPNEIDAANPATGEVLDRLDEQPAEKLAEALDAINVRAIEFKRWQGAIETELRRRLRLVNRNQYVWGGWEVVKTRQRESVWDVDELRSVIDSLVEEGTVKAAEVADVIVVPPAQVKREHAKRLASSLNGAARKAVEACCEWKDKRGSLSVHKSVELVQAEAVGEVIDETVEPADALEVARTGPVGPPPGPSDPAREAREYAEAHGEAPSETAPAQPTDPQELFA